MDSQRFLQYARYDLTINRTFYRNTLLTTGIVLFSITLLGFLFRWLLVRQTGFEAFDPDEISLSFGAYDASVTVLMLTITCGIFQVFYAGCIHHPLRNKHSRITVLTLPATNGEKFLWHLLLVVVGGLCALAVLVVASDAINYLLSILVGFPSAAIPSLTKGVAHAIIGRVTMFGQDSFALIFGPRYNTLAFMLTSASIVSSLWTLSAFILGNSIKWRMNIVWTMLVLWILQTICSIGFLIIGLSINDEVIERLFNTDGMTIAWTLYGITMFVAIVTIIIMMSLSWRCYCRAQITNRLNR